MEYFLFVLYLVLFAWLVTKVKFFTRSGLTKPQLIIAFLLKTIAGIFYGWVGLYYGALAKMSDTWNYHFGSISEYQLLLSQPKTYLTNLFYDPYDGGFLKFFSTTDSYWNDLKGNFLIKILSVFNIFSTGNYYINVIFYSFITLFGLIAFYRVLADVFPKQKITALLFILLIPSFLFWASGLHKEGLIFTGIAGIIYIIYFSAKEKKITLKRIAGLLISILLVLTLRNFTIVLIIPAILAWLLAFKKPEWSLRIFATVYFVFIIAFFSLRYVHPGLDFPQAVVTKQQEFLKLVGNSTVPIKELKPTVAGFLENTPQAVTLSSLRPYVTDVRHILSLAAFIEINLLLLLFLLFLFFRKKNMNSDPAIFFCIFFAFSLLLTIGFSINNLGAIARYRCIVFPLLIAPMAIYTDWGRVASFFKLNEKNK